MARTKKVTKSEEKNIPANLVKVHEIDLTKDSWESLALEAKKLHDKAAPKLDVLKAANGATIRYNEKVNEERNTVGKVYGGFRLDNGRLIAWVNGTDYRMDSFLLEHWSVAAD